MSDLEKVKSKRKKLDHNETIIRNDEIGCFQGEDTSQKNRFDLIFTS